MSSFSEGQTHQLMNALEGVGFTAGDVTSLGQFKFLGDFRGVLRGTHEIKPIEFLVDLDADPFVPSGLSVEKHTRGGPFKFDDTKVKLYWSKKQKKGVIIGNDLRKEIEPLNPFNANLLDWYLKPENQKFIPEDWKTKVVFFWGTIYRDSDGYLYVRYLCWSCGRWCSHWYWLDNGWGAVYPALVPASV